jgi:hypothetical protein
VNGIPSFFGRVLVAAMMTAMSASVIRRGRPPAQCGSSAASPAALNAWITRRTVSSHAARVRPIAGTVAPDEDVRMIIARRAWIVSGPPRRAIRNRRWPSVSVSRRARTALVVADLTLNPHDPD